LGETHGGSLDLGAFQGIVYYTSDADGYRVVTTLAPSADATPVRFTATLSEGQMLEISVPGALGEADRTLRISRTGGKLLVVDASEKTQAVRLDY
jgi:uncharacterized protein (DUF1684 family)